MGRYPKLRGSTWTRLPAPNLTGYLPPAIKHKAPSAFAERALSYKSLAVTYFHKRVAHYHRRDVVSRSCSGWEGVGPTRYGRQA